MVVGLVYFSRNGMGKLGTPKPDEYNSLRGFKS